MSTNVKATSSSLTEAEALELGRRWVARGIMWAPETPGRAYSIRTMRGNVVLWDHGPDTPFLRASPWDEVRLDVVPDLRDPSTVGVLLHQVREWWADKCISVRWDAESLEWFVDGPHHPYPGKPEGILGVGPTEPHALVAALEAATTSEGSARAGGDGSDASHRDAAGGVTDDE